MLHRPVLGVRRTRRRCARQVHTAPIRAAAEICDIGELRRTASSTVGSSGSRPAELNAGLGAA